MMRRKLVCAIALAGALQAGLAHAVGLGQVKLHSALNQPLSAEIELLSVGDLDDSQIFVKLASQEDFNRVGVDRDYFLTRIRFDVDIDRKTRSGVVRVRTSDIVREPFLNFVVEARWPNGRVLREYTVLLDLPVTQGAAAGARAPVVEKGVSATRAATQPRQPAPVRTAVQQPNREAAAPRPRAAADNRMEQPAGEGQYRIQNGDSLWSIANRTRPSGVSAQQAMLALQAHNPEAFASNNINRIKAGYVLRIPSESEIAALISHQDALQEVAAQNQAWRDGTDRPLPTRVSSASEAPVAAPEASSGRLELSSSAPQVASGAGSAAAATGAGPAAEASVTAAETAPVAISQPAAASSEGSSDAVRETLAATESEKTALQGELSETQGQLETLERLVELKDQQMAALQNQEAAAAQAQPAAAPQAAPAPTTEAQAKPPFWAGWDMGLIFKIVGGALLALIALLVLGLLRRNKKKESRPARPAFERKPVLVATTGTQPVVSAEAAKQMAAQDDLGDFAAEIAAETATQELETLTEAGVDTLPDLDVLELPDADTAVVAVVETSAQAQTGDVIGEADIYASLGRHGQAASLLKNALQGEPMNTALHLKLLEVYVDAGDRDAFRQHYQSIQDNTSPQTLGRAKELLLGVDDPAVWLGEKRNTLEMPVVRADDLETLTQDTIDIDVSGDDATATDLDFLADDSSVANTREVGVVELDDTGEFDFSSFGVKEAEAAVAEDSLDLGHTDDLDFLAGTDEVSTKLDLARAYVDMGDVDGARDILQEVIQDGDAAAKTEARKLLDTL